MELLAEHLACWGCHIAFPELSFLTVAQLRKFVKATPVERFRRAVACRGLRAAGPAGGAPQGGARLARPVRPSPACSSPLAPCPPPRRKGAKSLVEAVERNARFVGRARDQADFSPKDLAQVGAFLAKEAAAKQVWGRGMGARCGARQA